MSKVAISGNASGTGVFTIAAPNSNSDRTLTLPDNSNASALSIGTVPAARLGSGTADSTTFLRGDNTWQTISTSPTTAQVLAATAGASVGAVGTYAMLTLVTLTDLLAGSTRAGSGLRYAAASGAAAGTPSGTWQRRAHDD